MFFLNSMPLDEEEVLNGLKTTHQEDRQEDSKHKHMFDIGDVIAGRYEVLQKGIIGGMGSVYKVRDRTLNKIKALKMILPQLIEGSESAINRFKQEVAVTQDLNHENIVRVFDIGESEGMLYFTMEWVDGITLRQYINDRKKTKHSLNFQEVREFARQICSAMSYAHKITVHRDIKPENIMVIEPYSESPKLKIMDFGIAKMESWTGKTTSSYIGSPIYMAPEQYNDASNTDKRADIYSIGAVLYELMTFNQPLGTFSMPSEINTSIPKQADTVIKKSLDPDKNKRYKDTIEVINDLEVADKHVEEKVTVPNLEQVQIHSKNQDVKQAPITQSKSVQENNEQTQSQIITEQKQTSMPQNTSTSKSKFVVIIGIIILSIIGGLVYKFSLFSSKEQTASTITQQSTQDASKNNTVQEPQSIPLELHVNIIGQRQTEKKEYEEIQIKNGAVLKTGDNFQIHLMTTTDSYVYVLIFDSEGKAGLLFPSATAGTNNRIKGGKTYHIPSGNKWFFLDDKTGTETIYVLADVSPMNDIEKLLKDMEHQGNRQQIENSNLILEQAKVRTRGVSIIEKGNSQKFKTSDGDVINSVTEVVKGKGSLVWSISFKHI